MKIYKSKAEFMRSIEGKQVETRWNFHKKEIGGTFRDYCKWEYLAYNNHAEAMLNDRAE